MSDLHGLWQWLLGAQPRPAPPRRLVVLAGSAAQVGTSTAAAWLARAVAASGRRVLLVDVHGALAASLDVALDAPAEPWIDAAPDLAGRMLDGWAQGEPTLRVVGAGITLATAGAPFGVAAPAPAATRAWLRRLAELSPHYDAVLVDAGARLSTIRALWAGMDGRASRGDRVVVVTTPAPAAAAAAYALAKLLPARLGVPRVDLLVNRADAAVAAATFGRVETAAQRFQRRPIGYAGVLPDEPALRAPVSTGPAAPEAPLLEAAAAELLRRLLAHAPQPARQ